MSTDLCIMHDGTKEALRPRNGLTREIIFREWPSSAYKSTVHAKGTLATGSIGIHEYILNLPCFAVSTCIEDFPSDRGLSFANQFVSVKYWRQPPQRLITALIIIMIFHATGSLILCPTNGFLDSFPFSSVTFKLPRLTLWRAQISEQTSRNFQSTVSCAINMKCLWKC